jgi:hypothetical protein
MLSPRTSVASPPGSARVRVTRRCSSPEPFSPPGPPVSSRGTGSSGGGPPGQASREDDARMSRRPGESTEQWSVRAAAEYHAAWEAFGVQRRRVLRTRVHARRALPRPR